MRASAALAKYDHACRAIAEAKTVDEAKDIRDKAVALAVYARQAKNRDLEADAVEIRMRATRRLDQLRVSQKESAGLNTGARGTGTSVRVDEKPTLAEQGVDKNLAHQARKLGALSDGQFEQFVDGAREAVSRAIRGAINHDDKAGRRAKREQQLAAKQTALPNKLYGVIYADPEWRFEPYSRETGMDRAADNHYPTSETDLICTRPVGDIAADDAVLFLWATVPMLQDALRVVAAWGFVYKSHAVWKKDKVGTGYWFRNQHELLLVGTKGNIPAPAPGSQFSSVLEHATARHSEKPDQVYMMIEAYFPNLPKIELNARSAREGWDAWGYEAPSARSA